MMLILAKRKPCSTILPLFSAAYQTTHIRGFCCPSAIQNPVPKPCNFSLNDYLVASWGFSPDKAASFSKRLPNIKSPEKSDAVVRFLIREGFSKPEIWNLVTWRPSLFNSCPETTLEPNLNALRGMGLSTSTLNNIILTNPGVLRLQSAVPKIKFWLDFFGGNETVLLTAFKLSTNLVGQDIGNNIGPKISFMNNSVALMEKKLERAKELGFQPESGMFVAGLRAVSGVSTETLHKKMLVFKNFGWQEHEFLSAVRRAPSIVKFSEENLREKIDFLLREARFDLSDITSRPVILTLSLEKRLRPYLQVLHLLESKGLFSKRKGQGLGNLMTTSNNKFVEKFILSHQDEIPELHEAFLAASRSLSQQPFQKKNGCGKSTLVGLR